MKKRIGFLSTMAFDANISIIKRLRDEYDIYFYSLIKDGNNGFENVKLHGDITEASEYKEFQQFKDFIELDKTFLVKHYEGYNLNKIKIEVKLWKHINRIKPQLYLTDAAQTAMILPRLFNKRRVVSIVHDPFPHTGEDTIKRKAANKMLVKLSSRYLIFNENQREEFIKYYKLNPTRVYNSFLSSYEFLKTYEKKECSIKKDGLTILFYGRISPYKGVKYLLDAVCKYYKDGYDGVNVIVAGAGKHNFDTSDYENLPFVEFRNYYIARTELTTLIKTCDAVICPYTDATQSGVIMSSFVFNKPVIATKVGGLPEMLNNGELGILIPPKDVNAIEEVLIRLHENPQILEKYCEKIANVYEHGEKSWEKAIVPFKKALNSIS